VRRMLTAATGVSNTVASASTTIAMTITDL
jgi:hypothetical protein